MREGRCEVGRVRGGEDVRGGGVREVGCDGVRERLRLRKE